MGIWVALDDATKDNGGMWGVSGSHKKPTNYFMKLVEDKNGKQKAVFDPPQAPVHDISKAVPLEAEKGSVVLLHGDFVHHSYANTSPLQRHAYTIHVVESRDHVWEKDNWIQRKENPFRFMQNVNVNF